MAVKPAAYISHQHKAMLSVSQRCSNNKARSGSVRCLESRGGGGKEVEKSPPPLPSLKEIRKFAVPCFAVWVAAPMLSLVDTATVGLSAGPGEGPIQLGALGPATTFLDGAAYLFAFLNVATTNLYATATAKAAQNNEDAKAAGDAVVRTAAKISLLCGIGLTVLLLSKAPALLALYIGHDATSEASKAILSQASEYANIRGLSMPTALLYGVLQAALLGAKDSLTPLIAIAYSTVVNVVGDLLCVCKLGMGLKGAAIATLLAQWAGTLALIPSCRKKLFASKPPTTETKVSSKSFLKFAAPVLTLILGKLAAFGFMTHVAASLPAETALASHQIVLSLFFFLSPCLEVISQTAQAFLPTYYAGRDAATTSSNKKEWNNASNALGAKLLKLGLTVGIFASAIAASVPLFFSNLLTNDLSIQTAVKPLALPLALAGLLTAPVAVSEGVLLARRELKYLASVYLGSTIIFPMGLLRLKKTGGPVSNVWYGFAAFQLFRAICFTGKLWGRALWNKVLGGEKDDTSLD